MPLTSSFQNPARAGVDPVLRPHPSFGFVCLLSFFLPIMCSLWGEAGAPGGTVRRAAVRKRGSGSISLY